CRANHALGAALVSRRQPRPPRSALFPYTTLFRSRIDAGLEWLLGVVGLHVDLPLDRAAAPTHPQGDAALWQVRFPRIVLGVLVGAALAVAGALMQGVFGNPLAEPAIIGVSPGAAVGASLAIVLGLDVIGGWAVPLAAFAAAL